MSTAPMSPVRAVSLVATREIRSRLRSKAFLAITAVLVSAVVGTVLAFHLIGRGAAESTPSVGVTPEAAPFVQLLERAGRATGQPIRLETIDREAGEQQVRGGDLSALLVEVSAGQVHVIVKSELPHTLRTIFEQLSGQTAVSQAITDSGGDPMTVDRAIAAASVTVQPLQAPQENRGARIAIASVVGVLTYIMLLISIQLTGQGVVEEKANRIVELLLSTIRPWELLAGKVIGVGVVTIAQVTAMTTAGAVTALATGVLRMPAGVVVEVAAWAVLWYLLGYFLYALVIAAAASLVSRQEDLAAVATPVSVVIIAAYLAGQTMVPANPNGTAVTVLSMIPFFSPVLMPMRAPYSVPGWQVALALVLTVAALGVIARIAGRIYGRAVLLTGSRVSLRAALALPR
ncbi:ABC transporter permease [Nocardia sp. NPDC088792]|uniref:ABC transporter permease n=1 Tax=Nocardia sp. NPDC088792 TaxID=3364332 RepID=UPI003822DDD1